MAGTTARNLQGFQFTHPGKGATYSLVHHLCRFSGFNSRTLGRVRPHRGGLCEYCTWFQFTHPGKGATRPCPRLDHRSKVSIHAPWEGCDRRDPAVYCSRCSFNSRTLGRVRREGSPASSTPRRCFNSRTLGRVRPAQARSARAESEVSIHAPWEGCDASIIPIRLLTSVSIHAPWEGCDSVVQSCVL